VLVMGGCCVYRTACYAYVYWCVIVCDVVCMLWCHGRCVLILCMMSWGVTVVLVGESWWCHRVGDVMLAFVSVGVRLLCVFSVVGCRCVLISRFWCWRC
jgi:hypothetical protein